MSYLIVIILSILTIFSCIKYISLQDDADNEVELNKKMIGITIIVTIIYSILNMLLNETGISYIIFNILMIYNIIMAYTDTQCKYVWPIISYVYTIIGVIFIIISNYIGMLNILETVKQVLVILSIIIIFKLLNAVAIGDLRIMFTNYLLIIPIYKDITPLAWLLTTLIAMLTLIIINIKNLRKGQLREKVAFAPYILLSNILLLFI